MVPDWLDYSSVLKWFIGLSFLAVPLSSCTFGEGWCWKVLLIAKLNYSDVVHDSHHLIA